jgi:hypothetical protein
VNIKVVRRRTDLVSIIVRAAFVSVQYFCFIPDIEKNDKNCVAWML